MAYETGFVHGRTPSGGIRESQQLLPRRPLPQSPPLTQSTASSLPQAREIHRTSYENEKQLPRSPARYERWWRLEILWAATMLATLVAMVVMLLKLNGQESRTWGFITLNTIIAILTTILSSSMVAIVSASVSQSLWNWMAESPAGDRVNRPRPLRDLHIFDSASRGPLGGLRLIWRLRAWHPASLGAFIIVLNLGLGAFTQQLVSIDTQLLPNGIVPGMTRSERFKSVPFGDISRLSSVVDADTYTKAAVYNAAIGGNITDLLPSCPSGNCTYPSTPTLGMCGECTDVSSALNNTGTCTLDETKTWQCGYQLPNQAYLMHNLEHAANDSWVIFNITNVGTQGTAMVYNRTDRIYATVFSTIGLPPKAALDYWYGPKNETEDPITVVPPMQAHECALWWCIQTFQISVEAGVSKKTVLHTWSEATGSLDRASKENFTNIPPETESKSDVAYGVDYADQLGVTSALQSITSNYFQAYVQFQDDDGLVGFGPLQGRTKYDLAGDVIEGVWQGSGDFHNANGTGWINTMARSLSRNIALTSPAKDNTAYQGTDMKLTSFFTVRWPYIAFPVLLVVLCLVFWLWTVLETRRKTVRPWRVGMLPLLLMRADEDVRQLARQAHALDRPNGFKEINKIELRLRQRSDGDWGFERPLPRQSGLLK